MAEHHFGLYRGHLSAKLIDAVERRFPDVFVINFEEPSGERRGWFAQPNCGEPQDSQSAAEVLCWALDWAETHGTYAEQQALAAVLRRRAGR